MTQAMTGPEGELWPEIPGFQLLEEIGKGATSRVFRACQLALDREVALKVITTLGEKGRQRSLRLFREARLAGALDHPGIVRGVDAGEGDGLVWFAMEYVEGFSLQEILDQRGHLEVPEVLDLAETVLAALSHAHAHGVVHRDIKPANLLVDVDGNPRLLDLGLAKRRVDPDLTQEGATVGTPQYMAPEQATDPGEVDPRSDLFSLGSMLYRALCGVAPFDAPTVAGVLTRLLGEEPKPPSRFLGALPQAFDYVLLRSLSKPLHQRYQSAGEFLSDVRALREGRHPERKGRRRRVQRLLAGSAILVTGAMLLLLMVLQNGDPGKAEEQGRVMNAVQEDVRERLTRLGEDSASVRYGDLQLARGLTSRLPEEDATARAVLVKVQAAYLENAYRLVKEARTQAIANLKKERDPGASRRMLRESLESHLDREIGFPEASDGALRQALKSRIAEAWGAFTREHEMLRNEVRERLKLELRAWYVASMSADEFADRSTLESESSDFLPPTDLDFLSNEQRLEIRTLRREHVDVLARRPFEHWKSEVERVGLLADKGCLASARMRLDLALDRVRSLIPGAEAESEVLRHRLAGLREIELGRARALRDLIKRSGVAGLLSEERERRTASMRSELQSLGDPSEIEGLAREVTVSRRVVAVAGAAVRLRSRVLEAIPESGMKTDLSFRPRLRGKGLLKVRQLLRREGSILVARDQGGFVRSYEVSDLLAPALLELGEKLGFETPPGTGACLAYLDGDDDLSLEMLGELPEEDAVRQHLERLGREAVTRRLGTLDRESDRDAYQRLVAVRRSLAAGEFIAAEEMLGGLRTDLHRTRGWHGHPFWTEFGAEVEALEEQLRLRSRTRERWRTFGKHVSTDLESRLVKLRLPLGRSGATLPGVRLPPRATQVRGGVILEVPHRQLSSIPPQELPGLVVALPFLGDAKFDLRFQVEFEKEDHPPSFLAVSLHDIHCVVFDRTRDGHRFRPWALHGLERKLFREQVVGRGGFWRGDLKEYDARMVALRPPLALGPGKVLPVRITADAGGRGVRFFLGERVFNLPKSSSPALRDGGLRITGFPTLRIRGMTLDATIRGAEKR